jgi:hypothetical protein
MPPYAIEAENLGRIHKIRGTKYGNIWCFSPIQCS